MPPEAGVWLRAYTAIHEAERQRSSEAERERSSEGERERGREGDTEWERVSEREGARLTTKHPNSKRFKGREWR